jgi:hypothetical protein
VFPVAAGVVLERAPTLEQALDLPNLLTPRRATQPSDASLTSSVASRCMSAERRMKSRMVASSSSV